MTNRLMLNKPSSVLVLDLINYQNRTNLSFSDVSIGIPKPAVVGASPANKNTSVLLTGTPGTIYDGTANIYYNRLAIDLVFGNKEVGVLDDFNNLSEAVELINRDYNLAISVDEVSAASKNSKGNIVLKIRESLVYLPNSEIVVMPHSTLLAFEGVVDRLWYYANFTLFKQLKGSV